MIHYRLWISAVFFTFDLYPRLLLLSQCSLKSHFIRIETMIPVYSHLSSRVLFVFFLLLTPLFLLFSASTS